MTQPKFMKISLQMFYDYYKYSVKFHFIHFSAMANDLRLLSHVVLNA